MKDERAAGDQTVIDDATFDHLERLARLSVPDDERADLKADLAALLAFVAQLEEIDVSGVAELTRPVAASASGRPDALTGSLPRVTALELAPARRDGFFEVPRTVDEG